MATTLESLTQDVLLQLEGFTGDQAVVGVLPSTITDTATSITLPLGGSAGVWEIEEELVNVTDYNTTSGAATAIRGWRGTTKAAHNSGVVCRNAPRFPVSQVKKAINQTVSNLSVRVPAVAVEEFTPTRTVDSYELPAGAQGVLSVSYTNGVIDVPITHWKFQRSPGGTLAGSCSVEVICPTGYTMRVVYAKHPTELAAGSDLFTATGLQEFSVEAVLWGAMWRLYSTSELGLASTATADQQLLARTQPVGSGMNQAKYLLGMYQSAVDEAERRFNETYPAQIHRIW